MTYLLYDMAINGPFTFLLLKKAYPNHHSLFEGTKDEKLNDVAPYIFEVDELLFQKTKHPLQSLKHIVFIKTLMPIKDSKEHLQQFIYQKENGKEYFFRFWDARVLSKVMPAFPPTVQQQYFENIDAFILSNEENKTATMEMKKGKVKIAEGDLAENFLTQHESSDSDKEIESKENKPSGNNSPRQPRKFFFN